MNITYPNLVWRHKNHLPISPDRNGGRGNEISLTNHSSGWLTTTSKLKRYGAKGKDMILHNAAEKVRRYNRLCVHYNLAADGIYRARGECNNPFGNRFHPFLIAGLISFDLGRMMGKGAETRYDPEKGGYAARLMEKIQAVQQYLHHLTNIRLCEVNLAEE